MSSEGNKINYGTSFQPTEPSLCANGCGFFGSASTMNLCSKCFRDLRNQEEQAASARAAMEKLVMPNKQSSAADGVVSVGPAVAEAAAPVVESKVEQAVAAAAANRCRSCRKKVGVVGFKCRCGSTFCGTHRYPEHHDCEFDFKSAGRENIAKANPVVKADKIDHRI